ncbi:hypothetical protein K3F96_15020 [Acinetobacter baumannii]|uniref:hypothetical protein n=1 Tax=Acinetobacter baumannii TaxID=470 RepID=UPI0023417C05|nr:hypothetical protein [Acinetobacter baumannii]MDC4023184.1 hypothetical protein [Acinetobacter baumannii]MDC4059808.1 hypothetical protein [Acinetobacter baumannii]MDC4117037.1 hypothetical protein [Acinetobacter baumannii]MDC4121435.1 hypothetical protein [Acinetobacter baumannii]MDC4135623.1 hypothetical protein [Acinetobacter baumannii]
MIQKKIKPDLDLVFARFSIFGMVAIVYTALSANGFPSWFLWLVLLCGVFSIFEAAIKADEVAVEAEATQGTMNQLKWLVNHQHKIITQHDQSLERMLEFKKQIKDHVLSLRSEYNLWSNEEIPQIEAQLDHLDGLIEANSQKCKCTDLPKAQKFFNKLIICHQCGKEHLM